MYLHGYCEELCTFAVGHLALGYLAGKTASELLDVNTNIPLLFVASVIPDIDLLLPGLQHRGPIHSLILFSLLFLPAFIIYGKKSIPYFIAVIQHALIGDYMTGGGTQLLWPLSLNWYGTQICVTSLTNVVTEWIFFLTSLAIMFKTKDLWVLFQRHTSNLLLSIPVFTVLLPTILSFPLYVPLALVIPHLTYLAIFTFSIFNGLKTRPK